MPAIESTGDASTFNAPRLIYHHRPRRHLCSLPLTKIAIQARKTQLASPLASPWADTSALDTTLWFALAVTGRQDIMAGSALGILLIGTDVNAENTSLTGLTCGRLQLFTA